MQHLGKIAIIKLVDPETLQTVEMVGRVTSDSAGALCISTEVIPGTQPVPEGHTLDSIAELVCNYYRTPLDAVRAPGRVKTLLDVRRVAMWFMRKYTPASLPEIGRYFGRDHSTVMLAITVVDKSLSQNRPVMTRAVGQIERRIAQ